MGHTTSALAAMGLVAGIAVAAVGSTAKDDGIVGNAWPPTQPDAARPGDSPIPATLDAEPPSIH